MHVSVGLILYIIISIIGVLVKRVAENKQGKTTVGKRGERYPEVVSFEEIEQALVQRFQEEPAQTKQLEHIVAVSQDDLDDSKAEYSDEPHPEEELILGGAVRPKARISSLQPNLAQAVVMAEIIRPPRSKRPWPSR